MIGDRVHSDGERQQVTGHDKHHEDDLGRAEQFAAKSPRNHLSCIGHVGDLRVCPLELTDDVSRVR